MEFASLPLANCVSGLGLHLNEPRPATHPEFPAPALPVLMSSRNQSISLQSKVTGNQESCTPKSEEEGCPVLEALQRGLGPVRCLCPKHHRHRHLREATRCRAVSEKHPFSSCRAKGKNTGGLVGTSPEGIWSPLLFPWPRDRGEESPGCSGFLASIARSETLH